MATISGGTGQGRKKENNDKLTSNSMPSQPDTQNAVKKLSASESIQLSLFTNLVEAAPFLSELSFISGCNLLTSSFKRSPSCNPAFLLHLKLITILRMDSIVTNNSENSGTDFPVAIKSSKPPRKGEVRDRNYLSWKDQRIQNIPVLA